MCPFEQALFFEFLQITPDRNITDLKHIAQFIHTGAAILLKPVQDSL
jgi:hypothetical protein